MDKVNREYTHLQDIELKLVEKEPGAVEQWAGLELSKNAKRWTDKAKIRP